jgi:predicted nucleotidyltransferase
MPFWNSSAPRFLDRLATIEALRRLAADAAAQDERILRVVLFGSLATGRATIRSDGDLLIVLSDHPSRPADRIPEYLDPFLKGPLPVNVFPWTVAEMQRRTDRGDRFLARIRSEGIDLFGRPPIACEGRRS